MSSSPAFSVDDFSGPVTPNESIRWPHEPGSPEDMIARIATWISGHDDPLAGSGHVSCSTEQDKVMISRMEKAKYDAL